MSDNTESVRVLLVDRESSFLNAASRALESREFSVRTAEDRYQASSSIVEEKPDVVILDIKMPGISGEQVSYQVQDQWGDIPFIILTGYGAPDQTFKDVKHGIVDYVSKPCDINLLVSSIRSAATFHREPVKRTLSSKSQIRVLIVDDEKEFLESVSKVLSRREMSVVTAASGVEALQLLQEQIVDVAIVDIKMPGMEGTELLKHLKLRYPTMEVIILTGHPSSGTAFLSNVNGAYEYISKPPDIEELCSLIRFAFNNREWRRKIRQRGIVRSPVSTSAQG